MKTLRIRLLLGTAVGMALILATSAVVLYATVHVTMWAEFDDSLASRARSLAALVEREDGALQFELDKIGLADFMPSDTGEYYQLWTADKRVLARSPTLKGCDLARIDGSVYSPAYRSMKLPSGRLGRFVGMTFTPAREMDNEENQDGDHGHHDESSLRNSGEPFLVTLVVGRDSTEIDMTLRRLRLLLVCGCAGAILASVGVLSWLVRRGLKPLEHLAAEIATIGESNLSSRLRADDAPGELAPITARLNDLLIRLETAFTREKSFTADVAHELRTPLAGLRATLEVSLSKNREAPQYRAAEAKSLVVAKQMQRMVENLLELARADAGQIELANETVDLVALLRNCWAQFNDRATERRLEVIWKLPKSCRIATDFAKAYLVLNNIFDNAVAYSDVSGRVTIALHLENGQARVSVANTGSIVTEADVDKVFDRFWRGDAARASEGNVRRYGLGLPLCRKLTALLRGSLTASVVGGTFTICVLFPK